MAAEKNASRRTMYDIINEDLGFCPYLKKKLRFDCCTKNTKITKIIVIDEAAR